MQQDMQAMRVTFRVGFEVANPINYDQPTEGQPLPVRRAADTVMTDDERAAAYRAQAVTRATFRLRLTNALRAPEAAAVRVRAGWAPVLERTKHGDREPEEVRPVGVANG
jgi:hypothetical protein